MKYIIFVCENDSDEESLYSGPVPDSDAAYLKEASSHLKKLSDEGYMTGPGMFLQAMVKSSYVLDGDVLYWCIEWVPGLIVIRMNSGDELEWVALRSPIPNFGGRVPLPEDGDPDEYEHGENPQYNLIFTPWDAQFDEQEREWGSFFPAESGIQLKFEKALERVNNLGPIMQSRFEQNTQAWFALCQKNLENWCGEGLKLKLPN